ncbi:ribonuclease H-like domain-containing protein [Mycena metata]|uniref:DNA polymerase delta catalytic subunit n=1 Tax=Mycena metata TaxID=1033252 RepID=A0AAD7IAG6_9AGAR|nr:ribonuclease H-like domain-containing protein [Mycena metata]
MFRATIFLRRDLLPALTRLWNPVPQTAFNPRPFSNATYLTGQTAGLNGELSVAEPVLKESLPPSSFVDALKEMKPNHEDWSRPAPTPFDDLVFFHTELLWHQTAGPMMFGVTKANNSVCVRITDYSNSVPETKQLTRGMTWLKIPVTKYTHLAEPECLSRCQLELTAKWSDIEPQPLEGPPPLRVLSFDLECLGRENVFPQPELDPVIQISNVVSILGDPAPPFIRNVFTLGTCSEIAGASVISFDDEAALLQRWSEFVQQVDPDLVIGYNISGFDLPYLLGRAKALQLSRFAFLGRLIDIETARVRMVKYTSSRGSTRSWQDIPLPGRLQLDLMHYVRWEGGPTSKQGLSLNAVASRVLGEQKEDVHFTAIRGLQTGSTDTRRQLAVYCLKDAYLPLRLLEVLGCVAQYTKQVHEKGIQFNSVFPDYDDTRTEELARLAEERGGSISDQVPIHAGK